MKPYIRLFKSPNNYFFYDVNRDSVKNLTEGLYNYLKGNCDIPENTDEISELGDADRQLLKELIAQGYMSDHRVKTLEHFHTSDLEFQINERCAELTLQVTQACNLVCSYCPFANKTDNEYQRNHSSKKMDWETAKKGIDILLEHSTEIDSVNIGFYGGEPFLNFPLVKKAVGYAEEIFIGKEVSFSLTTNGTVFNDEIVEFLASHNFFVTFSIDGPPSIHDINRKKADGSGSYADASSSIKKLYEAFKNIPERRNAININMVINPENDFDEVLRIFDDPFFMESGIVITPTLVSTDKLKKKMGVSDDFCEKFQYNRFVTLMKYFGVVKDADVDPVSKWLTFRRIEKLDDFREVSRLSDVTAPGGPCVPGQRRMFINADGNIFPCEKANELADDLIFGNVNDGIDIEKAEKILNIARLTENECKNCFAFRHCTVCAVTAVDAKGFSLQKKLAKCVSVKKTVADQIKLLILKKEFENIYKRKINI